jgi:hypothetical protein
MESSFAFYELKPNPVFIEIVFLTNKSFKGGLARFYVFLQIGICLSAA